MRFHLLASTAAVLLSANTLAAAIPAPPASIDVRAANAEPEAYIYTQDTDTKRSAEAEPEAYIYTQDTDTKRSAEAEPEAYIYTQNTDTKRDVEATI
ncbi:hypothetical protein PVAG01_00073 [Phlyctema vagabunda]|uniref:Uncharacterized protein n=1 Tax=Phlyctema vagabunda TaxID=108571 RepID=A0ABR4PTH3_9HELO